TALDRRIFDIIPGPAGKGVKDYAGLFTSQTADKADEQIRTISRLLKRPVVVETFKQPPEKFTKEFQEAAAEEKKRLWGRWLQDRIQASRFKGIYILIS